MTLLMLLISIPFVKASCTNEELSELKKEARVIKVEYEHKGKTINEDGGEDYNKFNVDIINNFDNFINKKLKAYSDFNIYLDFSKGHNDVLTKEKIIAKKLLELYPYIRIKNIYPSIIP